MGDVEREGVVVVNDIDGDRLCGSNRLFQLNGHPLAKRLPFRRQPTTLRISHTTGIPRRSHIVSPQRHHAAKVSSPTARGSTSACPTPSWLKEMMS